MKGLSSRDQTRRIDFPTWAFLHAFILAFFAGFILWGFQSWLDTHDMEKYRSAHETMFNYIILIVAWLVTARPVYALSVRDKLVDRIHGIMDDLQEWSEAEKEKAPKTKGDLDTDTIKEIKSLFEYITVNVSYKKLAMDDPVVSGYALPTPKSEKGKKIWKEFRAFTKDQMFSRPASLDGLCQVLIVIFHLFLMPILLLEKESSFWQTVISNYILAVYTTGCVGVARELENPYADVTSQTLVAEHFQEYLQGIRAALQYTPFSDQFPAPLAKASGMRGSRQQTSTLYV